ncbi:MAG TPA: ABC transporter permease [Mucilaginibacter sp.]
MFKSYFKIAVRHLQKQKGFAFINLFGLSIGIACFSLLLRFAVFQFSFDRFHENAANIYRPYNWDRFDGGRAPVAYTDVYGTVGGSVGEAMKRNFPDVVNYVRMQLPWGQNVVRTGTKVTRAVVSFADPSFFTIFTFPLEYGSVGTALQHVNDIVVTETRAKILFGTADVVGKTIEIQLGTAFQPFRISGVAKDIPANSTIGFDVLGNFAFAEANSAHFIIGNNWHPIARETWVQLRPGSRLPGNAPALARFIRNFDPDFDKNLKSYLADEKKAGVEWKESGSPVTFRLQSLLSVHTDSWFNSWGFTDDGRVDPKLTWILLAVATGILLIACINFTTLAIGRSAGRSKEVGVRKVIGAEKRQIVFQFLSEAMLFSVASTLLGLLLAKAMLPWFSQLVGTDLNFPFARYPMINLVLVAVALLAGLLAGCYPALILSNFRPVEVLKTKVRVGGSNLFMKALVTFQFVLSIGLIVCTIVILRQTEHMIDKNPGFDKENVVTIDASQSDPNITFPSFKQALRSEPTVVGVTCAAAGLGAGRDFPGYTDHGVSAAVAVIDTGYIRVLGMQLLAGENLGVTRYPDSIRPLIINEAMVRAMGWKTDEAVGKEIRDFQGKTAIVEGVVKNFHYRPLSEDVKEQVFENWGDKGYIYFYVRLHPGNPATAIKAMERAWNDAMPGIPMKYSFLDEDLNVYYQAEQKWSKIMGWAGGISIFLACIGLLGLAALAAINRTKEIGVRRVLGASVRNIILLLSRDFLFLIFVSFLIATPLAWSAMHRWLQGYAERISINWLFFVLAGGGALLMALLSISFFVIKAASGNPVRALQRD